MMEVPGAMAVTRPAELTEATFKLSLDQIPPAVLSESCVVDPTQTLGVPVMASTEGRLSGRFIVPFIKYVEKLADVICGLKTLGAGGVMSQSPCPVLHWRFVGP